MTRPVSLDDDVMFSDVLFCMMPGSGACDYDMCDGCKAKAGRTEGLVIRFAGDVLVLAAAVLGRRLLMAVWMMQRRVSLCQSS